MTEFSDRLFAAAALRLAELADPERAEPMGAYLRHKFVVFGISSADRKEVMRVAVAETIERVGKPDAADIDAFARRCYAEPQREFHYMGVGASRRWQRLLGPDHVPLLRHLVITHSWWDTVDELASHVAGGIVGRHPEVALVMDDWAGSDNMWLARTAILHQLRFKDDTDVDRLFRYCLLRADEADFFYRKAIGWALRQYARTDPGAVRVFCAEHAGELSALSLREATKHL